MFSKIIQFSPFLLFRSTCRKFITQLLFYLFYYNPHNQFKNKHNKHGKVITFNASNYDLNEDDRLENFKDYDLILCGKCNQMIYCIICLDCRVRCKECLTNHDGSCLFCKQRDAKFNIILCKNCNQRINRSIICFDCYDKETEDEEKNRMKFGKCKTCSRVTEKFGCLSCNRRRFKQDFNKWNSGDKNINEVIKDSQLSAKHYPELLEWIPYEKFEKIKHIASGGFAEVYSATWIDGYIINWNEKSKSWNRFGSYEVALKVINNSRDFGVDFLNEVKNLKAFPANDCEGIIKLYGITQVLDTRNYALVFKLEDSDLRYHLNCNSHLHKRKLCIEYICLGLTNIHKHGLIHRDLHIGNILYSNGITCISDFGFCIPANEISSDSNGKTYGVMPYMAPEILCGKEYTQASDVYSLGVIINEIISLVPPFYNRSHDHYLAIDICCGLRPQIRKETPDHLKDLIQKCWDANPENRLTSEEVLKKFRMNISENELLDFDELIKLSSKKAIYNQLNYSNLPKPVNCSNQEEFISSRYTILQIQTEVHSECLDCVITD